MPPPPDLLTGASLFLDFDGTLVELASAPDAVVVDDRLRGLMRHLVAQLDGRVAVISGRSVEQITHFLDGTGFGIAGSHGLELRWSDGRRSDPPLPQALAEVTAAMHRFGASNPGVVVEAKPFGAALHYRMAPHAEAASHALVHDLADGSGLVLQPGKMMVELRAGGGDKGSALRQFMAEAPMAGTRPVFIGDDLTDEPAFVAAAALGGAGILVGEPRASAATYRLGSVAETLDWLDAATRVIA